MKSLTSTHCGCFAAAILLSACGGPNQTAVTPVVTQSVNSSQHASWMSPLARRTSKLLYVSNYGANEVTVYDNLSKKQMGLLMGFSSPQGQCVDAKGDVYIANAGNGTVVEYAHGGANPIKTFTTSGDAFGCSVDAANDLAVTDFLGASYAAGSVTVFPKGSSKGVTYSDPTDCHYIWTAGYDDKGNLVMIAENEGSETVTFCAVLKGAKSLTTLTAKGFTIFSPNSTMWDGKYLALGDQEIGGNLQSGFIEATLSGSTLKSHSQIMLTDTCDGGYTHVVEPFIEGSKNTPLNDKQSNVVVGANQLCSADLRAWHYPAGDAPFKSFTFRSDGQSVSIAN
ncbi:MAG TPA: hypothetical protein VGK84_04290 [Candidatus Tumulicola sp.]|jgi:hypothetical protein